MAPLCVAAQAENKFKCPCHGSQYNDEGKVIRGPAPLVRACENRALPRRVQVGALHA
jgi:phenylpropionate dioxygenase-like ring-hydroxylating dioxygenase large terminal subunit